jgi:hypothetical protein
MDKIIFSPINRSNDAELLKSSDRIIGAVKVAANLFPNPDPTLADIEKAAVEYRQSLQDAGSRDRRLVELKNQKKATLINLLVRLGAYINFVAKGDRAILLSSGFDVSAERNTSVIMSPIPGITVETPHAGEAVLYIQKTPGARAYMYQYTDALPTPDTIWVSENGLRRTHKFTKLKSDVRHWFRVVAIGPGGQVVYSEPVSKMVQ